MKPLFGKIFMYLLLCMSTYSCGTATSTISYNCKQPIECLSIKEVPGNCCYNSKRTVLKNNNTAQDITAELILDTLNNNVWLQYRKDTVTVFKGDTLSLGCGFEYSTNRDHCIRHLSWRLSNACFGANLKCIGSTTTGRIIIDNQHVICQGDSCLSGLKEGCVYKNFSALDSAQQASIRELHRNLLSLPSQSYTLFTNFIHVFLPGLTGTGCDSRETIIRLSTFESYGATCTFDYAIGQTITIPGTSYRYKTIHIKLPNVIRGKITKYTSKTVIDFNPDDFSSIRGDFEVMGSPILRTDYIRKITITNNQMIISCNILCITIDKID